MMEGKIDQSIGLKITQVDYAEDKSVDAVS